MNAMLLSTVICLNSFAMKTGRSVAINHESVRTDYIRCGNWKPSSGSTSIIWLSL